MVNAEFICNYTPYKSGDVVALESNKFKRYLALGLVKFHSECEAEPTQADEADMGKGTPTAEAKKNKKVKTN